MRYITSGDNFLSHSELSAHFGASGEEIVGQLRVDWPNGDVTQLSELATNQTVTLMADGPVLCEPAPGEVDHLLLDLTGGGADLLFTWENSPDADDYRVFADSAPDGGFPLVMGTAVSGATGLVAPVPPGSKFFVVAARSGSCLGPK